MSEDTGEKWHFDEDRMEEFVRLIRKENIVKLLIKLKIEGPMTFTELCQYVTSDSTVTKFKNIGLRMSLIILERESMGFGDSKERKYNLTFQGLQVAEHLIEIHDIITISGDMLPGPDAEDEE